MASISSHQEPAQDVEGCYDPVHRTIYRSRSGLTTKENKGCVITRPSGSKTLNSLYISFPSKAPEGSFLDVPYDLQHTGFPNAQAQTPDNFFTNDEVEDGPYFTTKRLFEPLDSRTSRLTTSITWEDENRISGRTFGQPLYQDTTPGHEAWNAAHQLPPETNSEPAFQFSNSADWEAFAAEEPAFQFSNSADWEPFAAEEPDVEGASDRDYVGRATTGHSPSKPYRSRRTSPVRFASNTNASGLITKSKSRKYTDSIVIKRRSSFPCALAQYGCSLSFASKNEWKRHVSLQHMKLGFWRCDMCPPIDHEAPIYNDFNRKDLFTQHLRRMHKNHPLNGSTFIDEFGKISDEAISEHQKRCYLVLRANPTQSSCLFCDKRFVGENSWEERMEHVGQHMVKDRKACRPVVAVEAWHEDLQLRDYLEREGLIERGEDGGWLIGDGKPRGGHSLSSKGQHPASLDYSRENAILQRLFGAVLEEQRPSPSPPLDKDDSLTESDDSSSNSLSDTPEPVSPYAGLLHGLMTVFSVPFHKALQAAASNIRHHQQNQDGTSGTQSSTSASGSSAEGASSGTSSSSGKRKIVSQEGDDGDGLDGHGQKKTRPSTFGDANASQTRFACFFYKRNPIKYKNSRSCPGPGWLDVHRLKEHIYRCHKLPVQCERCGATYDNRQLLMGHTRSTQACEVRNFPLREGVTAEQEIELRSRKRVKKDETEEEKWYRAYGTLFPYDDAAAYPTPYYKTSECEQPILSAYHEFLRLEMPAEMQQQLAQEIEQELSASPEGLDERLRRRLPSIVHAVHRRLFRLFEESRLIAETDGGALPPNFLEDADSNSWTALESWFNTNDLGLNMSDQAFHFGSSIDGFSASSDIQVTDV